MAPPYALLLLVAAPFVLGRALLDLHLPVAVYPEKPYPESPYPEDPYPEPTSTTPGPTSTPTPDPPELTCDKYGYLIQFAELIRVNLATGTYETVRNGLGDNSAINALGYNPLDNYLYGYQRSTQEIIRIASDGSSSIITTIPNGAAYILGDFDADGYYWVATQTGAAWHKIDLIPGSATYGEVVESGTTPSPGNTIDTISDWVYVPIAGDYLWSLGANTGSGASLIRWGFDTREWEILASYPNVDSVFGALYGINNGTIYASSNSNGRIWAFDTVGSVEPYVASQGPPSSSNDGARCVANLEV
ncbi:uncharacterized protein DNG_07104 [Cephalotrichum gorgonifer]|uniref:DUF6923 domain-containing protein n=1 Tax=Cephalotrichum gorgonifer TaxID=2041049 RepID=A0AAE8N2T5_9PEZI|nr:uncharacterized protein DNG_07104 [Cephalotrichum gorgonifer]